MAQETTSKEKFEKIKTLLSGIDPRIDRHLSIVSNHLDNFEKIRKGKVIDLTLENLPERSEEEKKRKKLLLFLFKSYKQLRSEILRIAKELDIDLDQKDKTSKYNSSVKPENAARIVLGAKGKFGIISIAAGIVIVIALLLKPTSQTAMPEVSDKPESTHTVKVIEYNGKFIPFSQVHEFTGPECDGDAHYHANEGYAITTKGERIDDTNHCGFGKVKEVSIVSVQAPGNE